MCPTDDGIEDTEHFLLICPSFDVQRRHLLAGVSVVLRPFIEIHTLLMIYFHFISFYNVYTGLKRFITIYVFQPDLFKRLNKIRTKITKESLT